MSDPSLTLQCDCRWLDHQFRVTLMEDDGTASVEMVLPHRTFWERLRSAVRYVFGAGERSICDVVLSKSQVEVLRQFLNANEYMGWEREYQEKRQEEFNRWMAKRLGETP